MSHQGKLLTHATDYLRSEYELLVSHGKPEEEALRESLRGTLYVFSADDDPRNVPCRGLDHLWRNWPCHNLVAHPLSELLHWVGLRRLSGRLHDATIPPHRADDGRG